MAQWVKSPAAKSAEPSLILETHRVEKRPDSDPHKLSSDRSPRHTHSHARFVASTCPHIHRYTHTEMTKLMQKTFKG